MSAVIDADLDHRRVRRGCAQRDLAGDIEAAVETRRATRQRAIRVSEVGTRPSVPWRGSMRRASATRLRAFAGVDARRRRRRRLVSPRVVPSARSAARRSAATPPTVPVRHVDRRRCPPKASDAKPSKNALRPFAIISLAYLLFTTTDGAVRMIVLLHAYNKGFTAMEVAVMFALYELCGAITNLAAGVVGARWGIRATLVGGLLLQIGGWRFCTAGTTRGANRPPSRTSPSRRRCAASRRTLVKLGARPSRSS